jgi:hypothetical protein
VSAMEYQPGKAQTNVASCEQMVVESRFRTFVSRLGKPIGEQPDDFIWVRQLAGGSKLSGLTAALEGFG